MKAGLRAAGQKLLRYARVHSRCHGRMQTFLAQSLAVSPAFRQPTHVARGCKGKAFLTGRGCSRFLSVDDGDSRHVHDVALVEPADLQHMDGFGHAEQDGANGFGAAQAFQELIRGIARVERRKDQHIGAVTQPILCLSVTVTEECPNHLDTLEILE